MSSFSSDSSRLSFIDAIEHRFSRRQHLNVDLSPTEERDAMESGSASVSGMLMETSDPPSIPLPTHTYAPANFARRKPPLCANARCRRLCALLVFCSVFVAILVSFGAVVVLTRRDSANDVAQGRRAWWEQVVSDDGSSDFENTTVSTDGGVGRKLVQPHSSNRSNRYGQAAAYKKLRADKAASALVYEHAEIQKEDEEPVAQSVLLQSSDSSEMVDYKSRVKARRIGGDSSEDSKSMECWNTRQGRDLLADDQGFVCQPMQLDAHRPGCCQKTDVTGIEQYSCNSCNDDQCCTVYEYCVACCVGQRELKGKEAHFANAVKASSRLHNDPRPNFDLCMAVCRTSSQSVEQQRVYKDEAHKYCYTCK